MALHFFAENNDNNFPINGKYSCCELDFTIDDPYDVENATELNMQFGGIKGDLSLIMNDADGSYNGNQIISGSAYIDGDATNATVIFEVTFDDNTTGNFYYEGPITFMSED